MRQVEILEVAPRDGFQSVKPFIATDTKIALIEGLAECGFKRLEIGSFVSPKAIAQMADTPEILKRARLPKSLRVMALVPNAKGLERALEAGVREVAWVVSVSESHNSANVRRTVDESFRDFASAWQGLGKDRPRLRFGLSTCFDCPFEGRVSEDAVLRAVERVIETAPDVEIGICDTTGRAATDHVGRCWRGHAALCQRAGDVRLSRARHLRAGRGQCDRGVPAGRARVRRSGGWARRLSVRAGRGRQHGERGPGVRLRAHGREDRRRSRQAAADGGPRIAAVAPEQAGGKVRIVPRKRALAGYGAETRGLPA